MALFCESELIKEFDSIPAKKDTSDDGESSVK